MPSHATTPTEPSTPCETISPMSCPVCAPKLAAKGTLMRRTHFLRGTVAGAALPLAGLAVKRANAQTPPKLRVAGIPLDVAAIVYYGFEKGFFTKHGLDVEIFPAASGAAIAPA